MKRSPLVWLCATGCLWLGLLSFSTGDDLVFLDEDDEEGIVLDDMPLAPPRRTLGGLRVMVGDGTNGPGLQLADDAADKPLPDDAARVMEALNAELAEIQQRADAERAAIQQKADAEKRARRLKVIAALQQLEEKYQQAASAEQAAAIGHRLKRLKLADIRIYRDPGNVMQLGSQIGTSFIFEVTGAKNGPLWGTRIYTGDSSLAAAAVHLGILKPGQKGLVKATILDARNAYQGSTQHGVTSNNWNAYPFSYTLEPFLQGRADP